MEGDHQGPTLRREGSLESVTSTYSVQPPKLNLPTKEELPGNTGAEPSPLALVRRGPLHVIRAPPPLWSPSLTTSSSTSSTSSSSQPESMAEESHEEVISNQEGEKESSCPSPPLPSPVTQQDSSIERTTSPSSPTQNKIYNNNNSRNNNTLNSRPNSSSSSSNRSRNSTPDLLRSLFKTPETSEVDNSSINQQSHGSKHPITPGSDGSEMLREKEDGGEQSLSSSDNQDLGSSPPSPASSARSRSTTPISSSVRRVSSSASLVRSGSSARVLATVAAPNSNFPPLAPRGSIASLTQAMEDTRALAQEAHATTVNSPAMPLRPVTAPSTTSSSTSMDADHPASDNQSRASSSSSSSSSSPPGNDHGDDDDTGDNRNSSTSSLSVSSKSSTSPRPTSSSCTGQEEEEPDIIGPTRHSLSTSVSSLLSEPVTTLSKRYSCIKGAKPLTATPRKRSQSASTPRRQRASSNPVRGVAMADTPRPGGSPRVRSASVSVPVGASQNSSGVSNFKTGFKTGSLIAEEMDRADAEAAQAAAEASHKRRLAAIAAERTNLELEKSALDSAAMEAAIRSELNRLQALERQTVAEIRAMQVQKRKAERAVSTAASEINRRQDIESRSADAAVIALERAEARKVRIATATLTTVQLRRKEVEKGLEKKQLVAGNRILDLEASLEALEEEHRKWELMQKIKLEAMEEARKRIHNDMTKVVQSTVDAEQAASEELAALDARERVLMSNNRRGSTTVLKMTSETLSKISRPGKTYVGTRKEAEAAVKAPVKEDSVVRNARAVQERSRAAAERANAEIAALEHQLAQIKTKLGDLHAKHREHKAHSADLSAQRQVATLRAVEAEREAARVLASATSSANAARRKRLAVQKEEEARLKAEAAQMSREAADRARAAEQAEKAARAAEEAAEALALAEAEAAAEASTAQERLREAQLAKREQEKARQRAIAAAVATAEKEAAIEASKKEAAARAAEQKRAAAARKYASLHSAAAVAQESVRKARETALREKRALVTNQKRYESVQAALDKRQKLAAVLNGSDEVAESPRPKAGSTAKSPSSTPKKKETPPSSRQELQVPSPADRSAVKPRPPSLDTKTRSTTHIGAKVSTGARTVKRASKSLVTPQRRFTVVEFDN